MKVRFFLFLQINQGFFEIFPEVCGTGGIEQRCCLMRQSLHLITQVYIEHRYPHQWKGVRIFHQIH